MAARIVQIGDVIALPSANDGLAVATRMLTLGSPLVRSSWLTSLPAIVRYCPEHLGQVAEKVRVPRLDVKFAAYGLSECRLEFGVGP